MSPTSAPSSLTGHDEFPGISEPDMRASDFPERRPAAGAEHRYDALRFLRPSSPPPPISGCATTPAAGSASPSVTRRPKAGPRKAGGICRREPARPCSRATSSHAFIMSMPSITTTAANGPDEPICAPATRSSRSGASATAWRMAMTAPGSSKSIPASSAPGPCSSPNPPSSRRQNRLPPGNPLSPPPPGAGATSDPPPAGQPRKQRAQ